jgi:hypothetical protein
MSLFTSEIVRKELEEMNELYKEIYTRSAMFDENTSKEEQLEIVDKLYRLVEMQEILFTRVNLCDDPDSEMMKENFRLAAKQMGLPPVQIGPEVFQVARDSLENMKKNIEGG